MITITLLLVSYSDILWWLRWFNVASTSSLLFQVLRELPDLRGVGPAARGAQEAAHEIRMVFSADFMGTSLVSGLEH